MLSRAIAEKAIYPAVDPLDSMSRILSSLVVGERHYAVARKVQEILQKYRSLHDIPEQAFYMVGNIQEALEKGKMV